MRESLIIIEHSPHAATAFPTNSELNLGVSVAMVTELCRNAANELMVVTSCSVPATLVSRLF